MLLFKHGAKSEDVVILLAHCHDQNGIWETHTFYHI
jgi:hypothetical protein